MTYASFVLEMLVNSGVLPAVSFTRFVTRRPFIDGTLAKIVHKRMRRGLQVSLIATILSTELLDKYLMGSHSL